MQNPEPHSDLARVAVVCDFDDTAADRNVATMLLDAFYQNDAVTWRDIQKRFALSEISLAEYQEIAFSSVKATRTEQATFVKNYATLRPGFAELADYCRSTGVALAIVSHGLDYYVHALLEQSGVGHVPVHAVQSGEDLNGALTFAYPDARSNCTWAPGNCKCSIVDRYRFFAGRVFYAGDGTSDACPARRADFVFARDNLLRVCQEERLPHRELNDFQVVLEYLRELEAEDA